MVLYDRRQDDLANVEPKFGLELQRALRVKEQVTSAAREVVTEAFIERVVAHGLVPITNSIEEAVEMALYISS